MATWKKVVVSGSSAELAALKVDNLTSGQVVIGGGSAANLSTTAINGTGNILATTGATGVSMTGSFTGSFSGDGSGITGVTATFPTVAKTDLTSTDQIYVNDGTNKYVTYGNLLTDLAGTNLAVEATDSLTLATTITGITSISSTSFTGSLQGTASQAATASYVNPLNQDLIITGSFNLFDVASTFSIEGNGFGQTYLNGGGALALNPGFGGVEILGANAGLKVGGNTIVNNISSSGAITASAFLGDGAGVTGVISSSYALTASYALNIPSTSSYALTASQAVTASYALNAAKVNNSLTFGNGLTGTNFDGSSAITAAVGAGALITVDSDAVMVTTSSLTTNQIVKLGSNALVGSNITDTGTQVQIGAGASSGVTIAAGGINVTGNSTFNNNLIVSGDLTVAGTASFQNTQNLLVADQFILLASGSTNPIDGGIIVATGGLSGSAMYLEVASAGTYGRWAVASEVSANASAVTADEYIVSAKINQASNPSAAPTWGSTTNGSGNLWVTNAGDVFIYA